MCFSFLKLDLILAKKNLFKTFENEQQREVGKCLSAKFSVISYLTLLKVASKKGNARDDTISGKHGNNLFYSYSHH